MIKTYLNSVLLNIFLLLVCSEVTSAAVLPAEKTASLQPHTPPPARFITQGTSVIDLKTQSPLFFRGIGYSPFLPGETPLNGEAPGNDERYLEHFTLLKEIGANYLHVFPLAMPSKFFEALDASNIVYGQDIWVFPYAEDFLDEDYQAWSFDIIKNTIDHTYRAGRPDRLVLFSIGDELQADSVIRTNQRHPETHDFTGKHIVVTNRTATEVALAKLIDKAMDYELTTYGARHLYCHTSWTHIGPLADRSDLDVPKEHALTPDIGDLMCMNVYTYARGVRTSKPGSVTGSSYQGYLEELAVSTDKPVFITQVGVSTSAFEPKPVEAPGFGGHRIEDVPSTLSAVWKDVITARGSEKICGISFFELQDEWWKSGEDPTDSLRHEKEDPEEWFGLYEVDENGRLFPKGKIPETVRKLFKTKE
jgi:hypothetical protein